MTNPVDPHAEFPAGPGEPRNHNKKRRQDDDPPDSGGHPSPETTTIPTQPSSYKDTLLGDRQHEIPSDDVFLDEEDIDLTEDDVIRGSSNHQSSSKDVSRLDKSRHSSVTLRENSDPNILLPVPAQLVNTLIVEPQKKPPDPTDIVSTTVPAKETMTVEAHNDDISINANDMISDAYDAAIPNAQKRQALWFELRNLAHSIFCPWFIVGDFNATLSESDRQGCAASARPSKAFQDFVFDHGLRDMGFSGPDFTWSRGLTHVRLDRVLCNSYWDETFPESIVHHLFRMKSDHGPILFVVGNSIQLPRPKHFRYFSGWCSHDDFSRMVQDNWQSSDDIVDSIKHFTKAASVWNDTVFGYIGTKKRILMARLRGIQKALCTRRSHFLVSLETSLLLELEGLLDQEELLWRQKSRSEWITHGDRNTNYFHWRAISRRQKNRIRALKLNNGDWNSDDSTLKLEAVHFFSNLFSMDQDTTASFSTQANFQSIPSSLHADLDAIPIHQEIREALFDMAPLKSPGWDGLHAEFYQKQWSIVGPSISGQSVYARFSTSY
ncbi:hypothetical protein V6N13_140981 [Hibiscus sabdariffa]